MAREGAAAARAESAPDPDAGRKPDSPTDIDKPGWRYTAKAAFGEFQRDQCTDLAAALTYYSVLSVFPAILALVSLLGLFGQGEATTTVNSQPNAMPRPTGEMSRADVSADARKVKPRFGEKGERPDVPTNPTDKTGTPQ